MEALFPAAIDAVTEWFEGLGQGMAVRCTEKESGPRRRVWRLGAPIPELDGTAACLVLLQDFPLSPARIEVDRKFCLRLPHVEADGHLCDGVLPDAADFDDPVGGVKRVLARFNEYLALCQSPGWVEAEFHRERSDYWNRHAGATKAPAAFKTSELLLDVDLDGSSIREVPAIGLADGSRALATSGDSEPEKVANARGWPVGTIIRGSAAVFSLPDEERWSPTTWPKSFAQLNDLLTQLGGEADWLRKWHGRKWPNKAPLFIVLVQGSVVFGWRVMPSHFGRVDQPVLLPVEVVRVDRRWSLCRDHNAEALEGLSARQVVVFGAGSLGGLVIELLARAGVGKIEVVDPQTFEAENISRHTLGAPLVGKGKAASVCARVKQAIPGAQLFSYGQDAAAWLAGAKRQNEPDLVIDCTGEATVRIATSKLRQGKLKGLPVLMAWMEPGCAAAHVVVTTGNDEWPTSDPVETAVNIARWPADLRVQLPGCGQGFHPYGMADASRAAGLVAERALALLQNSGQSSAVWSMVRNRSYFLGVSPAAVFNREPPTEDDVESTTIRRALAQVLSNEA